MRRDLITALIATLAFTLLLGVAYPLAVTGVARLAMHDRASGSILERDGTVVGSRLVAQAFDRAVLDGSGEPERDSDGAVLREPDPHYFQPRPSQTGYAANGSGFLNLGPNQRELADLYAARRDAYLALEGPYDPSLDAGRVPVDAVTNSGSGIDPHVSVANARIQARRVAAERGADLDRVLDLVAEHTTSRAFGIFGERGVNVLELNLDLDEELPVR